MTKDESEGVPLAYPPTKESKERPPTHRVCACSVRLADARKLLAHEHVEDARATESGAKRHARPALGHSLGNLADDGGIRTVLRAAHGLERSLGLVGRHHAHHLALVGTWYTS